MESHNLALPVGHQIEHFRIEAVLGKGGFGITYLAVDPRLGKRVAIKELLPDTIATRIEGFTIVPHSAAMREKWEWARERFLEEARTLATFSHPAIVGVHRLIEANGTAYMVMDYVEGESYEARLQRIGTEPDQDSLMAVIGPILSGLEEVHSHGLLHRDIKPENILIDKRGQPVLIDFGSARESVEKTMTMTSIVTHGYSPIEQYQTKGRMGPWTDIYATAAVIFRAITGEKPPVATDRIVQDDFERLSQKETPRFSQAFRESVDAALRVLGEERPQAIATWHKALCASTPHSGASETIHLNIPNTVAGRKPPEEVQRHTPTPVGNEPQAEKVLRVNERAQPPFKTVRVPLAFVGGAAAVLLALFLYSLIRSPKPEQPESVTNSAAVSQSSLSEEDIQFVEDEPPASEQSYANNTEWHVHSFNGRHYLPLSQIAAFYKMRIALDGDTATLASDHRQMAFKADSRLARVDSAKHWLSFPVVYSDGAFYISRMDLSKTIDPLMRPRQIPNLLPVRTVVLDPAHGGDDSGSANQYGSEKNYTLDLARRIRPYLRKAGLRVVITRSGDQSLSATDRTALATQLDEKDSGTIFVNLQCNASSGKNPPDTGFEVFTLTPRGAPNSGEDFLTSDSFAIELGHLADHASTALAAAIHHAMLGRVPMFDNGAKRSRMTELRTATVPAAVIHCGFLSNPRDAKLMASAEWRERLAESIALGIIEFVSLTKTRKPPKLFADYRAENSLDSP